MSDTSTSYTCPAGYNLQIDLDANTQWCQSPTDANNVVAAVPKTQPLGILGTSTLVAGGLLVAALAMSASRTRPRRRRRR